MRQTHKPSVIGSRDEPFKLLSVTGHFHSYQSWATVKLLSATGHSDFFHLWDTLTLSNLAAHQAGPCEPGKGSALSPTPGQGQC